MNEQNRTLISFETIKAWLLLSLGLIFCSQLAIASQLQPSISPLALTESANLPSSVVKLSDKKTNAKQGSGAKPEWSELTTLQKIALQPLYNNWRFLGDTSKRKWIALSINFQSMTPDEQSKLQARMTEWVSFSQQERVRARLNFAQSKQIPQSHKTATWEAYQTLSPEEKSKLALAEKDKKAAVPFAGKNTQKPKLATAPMNKMSTQLIKTSRPLAAANLKLDRHTLLPRHHVVESSITEH